MLKSPAKLWLRLDQRHGTLYIRIPLADAPAEVQISTEERISSIYAFDA
jgi:hypothetical protein